MTEQHPSFGGVAVANPRTTTSPLDLGTEDAHDDNRRKLAVVGAIVAVLVVLVAAFFMLKSKGGSETTALPPHIVPPASGSSAASGTAAKAPKAIELPKPFHGIVGRDPFKPRYVVPVQNPAASSTSASTTTVTANPTSVTPVTPVVPVTPASTTAAPNPVWVELVSSNNKSATFVVGYSNGKKLTTKRFTAVKAPTGSAGRTIFAKVFALLRLNNGHALVQYGDGTPTTITSGPSHRLVVG
jgi:hypothetical protein